ncbi:MAG TPA: hypothetical protein VM575_16030 [Nocardioides sp.]|nr:hypothetical protein [Nocardioides sp.]
MSVSALPGPAAALAALLLASCGTEPTAAPDGAPAAPQETRVSCGDGPDGWPVSAMAHGIDSRHAREDIAAGLTALVSGAGIDAPRALADLDAGEMADGPWLVLAETQDDVTVASGPWTVGGPGRDGQYIHLALRDGAWTVDGWGDCAVLSPALPAGQSWVEVAAADGLDRHSTKLAVLVTERQCASGRDGRAHLLEPTVVETPDDVTVTWTSQAVAHGATCQGNPPAPMTIDLAEPLGDRALLDGSRWPARVVVPAS